MEKRDKKTEINTHKNAKNGSKTNRMCYTKNQGARREGKRRA